MTLIKHCRTILQQAEERIEKISREEAAGQAGEKNAAPEANEDDAEEGLF
jgi:exonuclease VII small subunit